MSKNGEIIKWNQNPVYEISQKKRENYLTDLYLTKNSIENTSDLSAEQRDQLQKIIQSDNWHYMVGKKENIQK